MLMVIQHNSANRIPVMDIKQTGFSLIEMAIVLVIIALLLGSVLKGQGIIEQSKVKNVIREYDGLSAAIHSYVDRYQFLPGDDPQAESRWTAALATNGDDDGIIDRRWDDDCTRPNSDRWESCQIWNHLRLAGFITGEGMEQPEHPFNNIIGIEDGERGRQRNAGLVGVIICFGDVPGKYAEILDEQMDDGLANSGEMRGMVGLIPPVPNYVLSSDYNLCKRL